MMAEKILELLEYQEKKCGNKSVTIIENITYMLYNKNRGHII